eukprot:gene31752-6950_t
MERRKSDRLASGLKLVHLGHQDEAAEQAVEKWCAIDVPFNMEVGESDRLASGLQARLHSGHPG